MRSLPILLAAILMLTAGCISTSPSVAARPPEWTIRTPQSKTAIYAVASWPPTFFEQDARDKAMAQARAELAKTLRVNVRGVLVDWASSSHVFGSQGHAEDFIATMDSETLDVSMTGSQIVSVWCDRKGLVSQPGTWWALAKLDKSSLAEELRKAALKAREELKKELAAQSKDAEDIEQRARKAFDELDKRLEKLK